MNKNKIKKGLTATLVPALLIGAGLGLTSCGNKKNDFAYKVTFDEDIAGQTIEFWTGFGADINETMVDLLKEFERLTGVHVNYSSKGGYGDVLKATSLAATNVEYPHVVVGYPDHFAQYVKQDIIVRLDYYFEHDKPMPFEGENKFKITDFYPDYMKENQSIEFDSEGNPYTLGIPFNKSTEVMIYNKTFFDYCASNPTLKDKIFVPKTYDELETVGLAILKFFKDNNIYGNILLKNEEGHESEIKVVAPSTNPDVKKVAIDLANISEWTANTTDGTRSFKPFSYDSQSNLFITTLRQFGGSYTYFDKQTAHGYIDFDSPETRAGLTRLKELYDEKVFGIPNDWGEAKYGSNPFKACKTVMTLGSSAGVKNSAPPANKFEIAAAPVPYHTADKKYVISQGANLALLDTGSKEQRLAAWTLVKFLTKYANGYICAKTGYYPSSSFAEKGGSWVGIQDQDLAKYYSYAEWLDSINGNALASTTEIIKAQTAQVNIDNYVKDSENWIKFVDAPFPGSATVREEVAAIPGWVFSGEYNIDQAITKMYGTLHDFVKKDK